MKTTSSVLTDQTRLCYRKHHSLQHPPSFRAMINLQPCNAVRDAAAHVPPSPLLPTASAAFYFLLASDPPANFFAHPYTRPLPFLLDFQVDLQKTFFRRPPSCVLFFARLQHRPFCTNSTQFDRCETSVTTCTISLSLAVSFCLVPTLLSGNSLPCEHFGFFLFRRGIFLCLYSYDPWWIIGDYFLFVCSIFFCMYSFGSFLPHL